MAPTPYSMPLLKDAEADFGSDTLAIELKEVLLLKQNRSFFAYNLPIGS